MKSTKRIIALLLVVALLIPNIPVTAKPQAKNGEELSYNLGDHENVLLSSKDKKLTWEGWTEG